MPCFPAAGAHQAMVCMVLVSAAQGAARPRRAGDPIFYNGDQNYPFDYSRKDAHTCFDCGGNPFQLPVIQSEKHKDHFDDCAKCKQLPAKCWLCPVRSCSQVMYNCQDKCTNPSCPSDNRMPKDRRNGALHGYLGECYSRRQMLLNERNAKDQKIHADPSFYDEPRNPQKPFPYKPASRQSRKQWQRIAPQCPDRPASDSRRGNTSGRFDRPSPQGNRRRQNYKGCGTTSSRGPHGKRYSNPQRHSQGQRRSSSYADMNRRRHGGDHSRASFRRPAE